MSSHTALSTSDEASSDEDEEDEDDSDGELPPPLLSSHHIPLPSQSSREDIYTFNDGEPTSVSVAKNDSNQLRSTVGPPSLMANVATSGAFSDSEDIKLDSQIDGIITNLEEDSILMGLGFLQQEISTVDASRSNSGSLRHSIDSIVTDMLSRTDAELPSTIGLPSFSEQEMCVVRDTFQLASSLPSVATMGSDGVEKSTGRKRSPSHEAIQPTPESHNLPTKDNKCRRQEPSLVSPAVIAPPRQNHQSVLPISRFEPLRHSLEAESPQPPSLEQQQPPIVPPPSVAQPPTNSGGGDIPDIISSVTAGGTVVGGGGGGDKDTDCLNGGSPRKPDQRDLLDEVLEDIQQLQDKEKQAAIVTSVSGYSKTASGGGAGSKEHEGDRSVGVDNTVVQQPKSLDSSLWSDSGYSSSVPHEKDILKQDGKPEAPPSAPADIKSNSLMAGLDAAATGSLSSLFRP